MSPPRRRAVLTGIGAITPLGLDLASIRTALRQGRSGIGPIRSFDASALPVRFAGSVEGFDARQYLDKKDRKRLNMMSRTIQFAVGAAKLALDDARLDPATLDPTRFGVVMGSGTLPSDMADLGPASTVSLDANGAVDLQKWGSAGLPNIQPTWMLNYIPNMPACHVSISHNAQGPNNTITITGAASLLALGEAYRVLERGGGDVFLTGGADTRVNGVSVQREYKYHTLSLRNDEPEKACRPFERDRDGLVLGEGGGVFVLEELEHARRRGATICGEVIGFGTAYDRARDGSGVARAIHAALTEAGIQPDALDHVNAHGDSTRDGDVREARGIRSALGESIPVLAAKSYIGDLGAGGSAVELAVSLLALADGVLPATLNYETGDPDCPLNVVREPRRVERPYFLKVARTDLGQCAAVVIAASGEEECHA
jgi:3-oxoacyl-[acyl-carrier-protein] synthase II